VIRCKTGIQGLDQLLCGGFLRGDSILVTGPPGSGKTTLGIEFLYRGVKEFAEPGLLISFEELPDKLQRHSIGLGCNLKKLARQNHFKMICTSPSVFLEQIAMPDNLFDQTVEKLGIQRVFIEGLNLLELEISDLTRLRKLEYRIFNHFTQSLKTTLMLSYEIPRIFGIPDIISRSGVDFLADCIIMLTHVKYDSELGKALMVVKLRGSDHEKGLRHVVIDGNGLKVLSGLENGRNLLENLTQIPLN